MLKTKLRLVYGQIVSARWSVESVVTMIFPGECYDSCNIGYVAVLQKALPPPFYCNPLNVIKIIRLFAFSQTTRQTRYSAGPPSTVLDSDPTLNQPWVNVLFFSGWMLACSADETKWLWMKIKYKRGCTVTISHEAEMTISMVRQYFSHDGFTFVKDHIMAETTIITWERRSPLKTKDHVSPFPLQK